MTTDHEDPGAGPEGAEPEHEPPAEAPEPPPEAEPEEPSKIWDPASRRWVTEHEIAVQPPGTTAAGPTARRRGRAAAGVVAALIGLGVGVGLFILLAGAIRPGVEVTRPPETGAGFEPSELARLARAWVVHVRVTGTEANRASERTASGIVVREEEGLIATTATAVAGADEITVTLSSGRTSKVEVVGADATADVAILQTDPDFTIGFGATLGTAEALRLGDPVVVVATPYLLQPVVHSGVIAAIGRTVKTETLELPDLLQIDAPLGFGGSGGVVVDGSGSAVAMTSSIQDTQGRIGYGVAIDLVEAVARVLDDGGTFDYPWIGVLAVDLDPEVDGQLDAPALLVAEVTRDGPADTAGIKPGDVILTIDELPVEGAMSLLKRVLDHAVGEEIVLVVRRGNEQTEIGVEVQKLPEA